MGVYVILDGVRREYPEATNWIHNGNGNLSVVGQKRITALGPAYQSWVNAGGAVSGSNGMTDFTIVSYGRYDLVGWMEEKE